MPAAVQRNTICRPANGYIAVGRFAMEIIIRWLTWSASCETAVEAQPATVNISSSPSAATRPHGMTLLQLRGKAFGIAQPGVGRC